MIKKRKYTALAIVAAMLVSLALPMGASAQAAPVAAVMGFSMGSNTINQGQTVVFTVDTTAGANNVVVAYDGKTAVATQDTAATSANKRWTVSFAPAKSQTVQLLVSASADITNAASLQIPINVNVAGTTPTTPVNPTAPVVPSTPVSSGVTINDITETSAGKVVTLTVKTNAAANNVWAVYDTNKYPQGSLVSNDGTTKTWTLQLSPSQIQVVTVSANTAYKTNGAANKDYTLEFTSSLKPPATATITSATLANSTINPGASTTMTIRTNADAQYVWVEYDGLSADAAFKSETSTTKTWSVSVSPDATGRIYVYANTFDGAEGAASRTVNITVRTGNYYYDDYYYEGNATIVSSGTKAEIDYGRDDFVLTVVTSPNVRYVRFRASGESYVNAYSAYTNTAGNLVWSYSGDADNRNYNDDEITVYASTDSEFRSSYTTSRTIDVDGYDSDEDSNDNDNKIIDFDNRYDGDDGDNEVEPGDIVTINWIEVGQDVEEIRIFDTRDRVIETFSVGGSNVDHETSWNQWNDLDFEADENGTYEIRAYVDDRDEDDEYTDREPFRLYVNE